MVCKKFELEFDVFLSNINCMLFLKWNGLKVYWRENVKYIVFNNLVYII